MSSPMYELKITVQFTFFLKTISCQESNEYLFIMYDALLALITFEFVHKNAGRSHYR